MHEFQTVKTVGEIFENQIVQMAFEPDPEVFIKWFRAMVGSAAIEDTVVVYETLDNRRGGFDFRCDPSTKAVMIAVGIGGIRWSMIFPGLLGKVNKAWKKQKR